MSTPRKSSANLHRYDPLDRLIGTNTIQYFYNKTRIATKIQDDRKTSIFEHDAIPLAEIQPGAPGNLLATDLQNTVLSSINRTVIYLQIYSPYGHRRAANNGVLSLLGFNGEWLDPLTDNYLLGQGHRTYCRVLMRFNSPDSSSPFGKGGLNSYAYCENDPINCADPSGKIKRFFLRFKLFKQPKLLAVVRRATNSSSGIKKTKITRVSKKTAPVKPSSFNQAAAATTSRNATGTSRNKSRTIANKKMDSVKAPTAQSRTALTPIHNFSGQDEWRVQLTPGLPPADSRTALSPIHNHARPQEWNVRLVPDPVQTVAGLIRTKV
ncbi:RHS repeat-associated core domain-containing protein [Pseudomonas sp. LB3P31]